MKHSALNLLLTVLLLFFTSKVSAQVGERRNDFSVGVSGGYVLNKMTFTPGIKQSLKTAPMFGLATRYVCEKYFNSICAVQAELNFIPLGWKELIEDGSQNQYWHTLNYLQLPLLMQMGWGRERRGLKFVFEAGPVLGYYLGGSEHYGYDDEHPWNPLGRPNHVTFQYGDKPYDPTTPGKQPDNRLDYGIAAGAGVEFSTVIGHFIFDARYYYGLGDVFDNSKAGVFGRSAHGAIYAKLTYLFDLKKTKFD